jgi:hypothetical protein
VLNNETTITEDAVAAHAEMFSQPQPVLTPSDYQKLYEEGRAENERLSAVIAAARLSAVPSAAHPQRDMKPSVTADRFKGLIGPYEFQKLTRDQKLIGMNLDPASVDDAYLKKVFGRGADGALGSELMKTSPFRYRQLKEAALVLNIYAG